MDKERFITVFEADPDDKYAKNGELIIRELLNISESLILKPEYDKENDRLIFSCKDKDKSDITFELLKTLADKDSGLKLTPVSIESLSDIKDAVYKLEEYCDTFFNGTFCPVKDGGSNLRVNNAENDLSALNGQKTATDMSVNTDRESNNKQEIKKYDDAYDYIMPYEKYFSGGRPNITPEIVSLIREQTGYDELLEMHLSELNIPEHISYTAYRAYTHKYPEMRALGYAKDFARAYFRLFNRLSPYNEEYPVLALGILTFDSFIRATLNSDLPDIK